MTATILNRWTLGPQNRALLASFTTTANVQRKQSVRDTQGGYNTTFQTVATYPCNFFRQGLRPRELEFSERVQDVTYWAFHFLRGVDVRATDRLVTSGRTFEVVGRGDGSSNTLLEVICMEIL